MKAFNLRNKIIKHKRNMDICYLITKSYDPGHKLKLKVSVQNMGYKTSYIMGVGLNIEIKKEDLVNWHVCLEPNLQCLRYAEWKRLV